MTAALVIEPDGVNVHLASAFISQYEALRDAFDLRKPVGRQYFPYPGGMSVPHDEVQVLVFAPPARQSKASTPHPPSSHTSALASSSHPRISTTSVAVIFMPEPYMHTVGGERGDMYVRVA